MDNELTLVSIIVPCYNEEKTIGLLLDAVYQQTYPRDCLEVIISDGHSRDRTRQVVEAFGQEHPDLSLKLVDNDRRIIPAALNTAIQAARGDIFVRLDAHSVPAVDYVERCVAHLQAGQGENVGGVWQIRPGEQTWIGRSIAAAAGHPLGVGDALYRYASEPGWVDTVPFGSFQRNLIEKIGLFDETLLTNEDYEFNTRVRRAGGRIYLDPQIRSQYFARADLGSLARQYWRYGFWKWRMLRRYPATIRWRQALPPLFVAGILGLLLISIFWQPALLVLGLLLALYGFSLVLAAIPVAMRGKEPAQVIGIPLAILTMHFAWGAGFLWSILHSGK